jgi:hypothetical protein
MTKLLALSMTLIIAALVFLGILSFQDKSKINQLERSPDRGKLSWRVQMAKAKGERAVNLGANIVEYAATPSFDDALANYSLVVAQPIYKRSYASTYNVETWYRFRLLEELSSPTTTCESCPKPSNPPQELLPLKPGEFLSPKFGGEAIVDGITITSSDQAFPDFQLGMRYLLFVQFDSQKIVGILRLGPRGTFTLDSNEKIRPMNVELNPFRESLSQRFGNSLSTLRRSLKPSH